MVKRARSIIFVICRFSDQIPADRKYGKRLKYSAKQDVSGLGTEIQMLMPGEAMITSPSAPFALPVKRDLYEDYVAALGKPGGGHGRGDRAGSKMPDSFFWDDNRC